MSRGENKKRTGLVIVGRKMVTQGPFGLNLLLLKLKTESTVAK